MQGHEHSFFSTVLLRVQDPRPPVKLHTLYLAQAWWIPYTPPPKKKVNNLLVGTFPISDKVQVFGVYLYLGIRYQLKYTVRHFQKPMTSIFNNNNQSFPFQLKCDLSKISWKIFWYQNKSYIAIIIIQNLKKDNFFMHRAGIGWVDEKMGYDIGSSLLPFCLFLKKNLSLNIHIS